MEKEGQRGPGKARASPPATASPPTPLGNPLQCVWRGLRDCCDWLVVVKVLFK
jgi:hypothetical protein